MLTTAELLFRARETPRKSKVGFGGAQTLALQRCPMQFLRVLDGKTKEEGFWATSQVHKVNSSDRQICACLFWLPRLACTVLCWHKLFKTPGSQLTSKVVFDWLPLQNKSPVFVCTDQMKPQRLGFNKSVLWSDYKTSNCGPCLPWGWHLVPGPWQTLPSCMRFICPEWVCYTAVIRQTKKPTVIQRLIIKFGRCLPICTHWPCHKPPSLKQAPPHRQCAQSHSVDPTNANMAIIYFSSKKCKLG